MKPRTGPQRDEALAHQVILYTPGREMHIHVTCNCRATDNIAPNNAGFKGHVSMGEVFDRFDTERLYNNPDNHRGPVPFDESWMLRFEDQAGVPL
jgi:hypothetical protein